MSIEGVIVRELSRHADARGWLTELFRLDDLEADLHPAMGYLSVTNPGIARGPHEHVDQTDLFVFLDGEYELTLWDNRPGKPDGKTVERYGRARPCAVVVPPGVVHAYRNVGESPAFVLNFPNRLYAGEGKRDPVDEIRHENDADSRFRL